jgi:hypothetical protein
MLHLFSMLGIPMLWLVGCTYWDHQPLPRDRAGRLPRLVRVSSAAGARPMVLIDPFVREDTLYGRTRQDTVGIAVTHITQFERSRVHGLRTVGTVLGGTAAWITLGLLSRSRD